MNTFLLFFFLAVGAAVKVNFAFYILKFGSGLEILEFNHISAVMLIHVQKVVFTHYLKLRTVFISRLVQAVLDR